MSVYTHNITQFIVEKRVFVLFFKTRLSCFSDATTENISLSLAIMWRTKATSSKELKKNKEAEVVFIFPQNL